MDQHRYPIATSGDRARADTRLAWLIVSASAVLMLVLLSLLLVWGAPRLRRWVVAQAAADRARAEAARQDDAAGEAIPEATVDSDTPFPVENGPAPPDTARPIGGPARWLGPDDYPPSALRNGYEGRVRVTVAVARDGSPTGCAMRRSSGHWSLDNATCAVMLNKGRFDPAPAGPRVRHWTSPTIRWVLPR